MPLSTAWPLIGLLCGTYLGLNAEAIDPATPHTFYRVEQISKQP